MPTEEAPKEKEKIDFVSLPFVPVYHVSKDGEITLHLEKREDIECQLKKQQKRKLSL